MKNIKRLCFSLAGVLVVVMTTATILEKIYGTQVIAKNIYGSWWFIALWAALAASAAVYLFRRKLHRRPAVFALHAAFGIILLGALVTRGSGKQGKLHLRTDSGGATTYISSEGESIALPFSVRLDDFRIEYYPGTQAPMDYVSLLTLKSDKKSIEGEVAMNKILRFKNYRLYQSSYDADGAGTTLSVSYDPWGIGITYIGYLLLFHMLGAFFFDRRSHFRQLLRHPAWKRMTLCLLFAAGTWSAHAAETSPPALPRATADELGQLYVYYNDRICPLSTLAKDFTVKLCGKGSYKGYTPEQVLSGWLFWYDDWKREPMIRIKSADARQLMHLEGSYARLTDFFNPSSGYALQGAGNRAVSADDEKFNLVSMVCAGSMLRLFPYIDPSDGALHWASQIDDLPSELPHDQWLFIRKSMDYVGELVAKRDYEELANVLHKIRSYQQKQAGGNLPSESRFAAERLYNRADYPLLAAALCVLVGAAAFIYMCRRMILQRTAGRRILWLLRIGVIVGLIYLSVLLALRGYASRHWPLSNGYETMQFMAWCTMLLTLVFHRRFIFLLPLGYLTSGLALMVSMMGASNPQITPLMPVLNSPLLSIHVMLVMVAYSLFAFMMFNGIAGLALCRKHPEEAARLQIVGRVMLYPAVFALVAGIFIGAIWANVSWGRYWGWDPKEVWALITMIIYALALHFDSLPWFRRPVFFHAFCIAAFLCVLITFFGVNFLLGGMHSYAG